MKFKIPIFIMLLIIGFSSSAYACTSFASYGAQIFYGMNFDYFSIPFDDQYEAISRYSDVEQVENSINGKQWIQFKGPSIHNLFADIKGNAIVTETDNKENFITHIENKFIVMSNFFNHGLAGKSYKEAVGAGADRYITAHDHIAQNMDSFSVDKGFELLEKVSLKDKDCSTLCSMIFQPQTNHIYIAVYQDFETIWKVSLSNKTIETHSGFDKYFQTRLGEDGILASDLESFGV
jgi:hypothetical protein